MASRTNDATYHSRLRQDAAREAARDAILLYRQRGMMMSGWRDGQLYFVDPNDIPLPEVERDREQHNCAAD